MENTDFITVAEFGGMNARTLRVMGIQASWELSSAGSFSAFTTPRLLSEAGLWGDLSGYWVRWAHPTAGEWGGVAIGRPSSQGLTEIAAEGFAVLMRGRVVSSVETTDGRPQTAGGAIRLSTGLIFDGIPTFITLGSVYDGGDSVQIALDGQDLYSDVLGSASHDGDTEWVVTADRVLNIGLALGNDLSASVLLVENREIIDYRLADDVWAALGSEQQQYESTNDHAVGASFLTGRTKVTRVRKRRRKHKGGRRDRHRPGHPVTKIKFPVMSTDPGPNSPSLLIPQDDLPRNTGLTTLAVPKAVYVQIDTIPLELTITDRNHAFANTELGNVVRVVIESAKFRGQFRVMSRALDTTTGTMTIAGEAMSDVTF